MTSPIWDGEYDLDDASCSGATREFSAAEVRWLLGRKSTGEAEGAAEGNAALELFTYGDTDAQDAAGRSLAGLLVGTKASGGEPRAKGAPDERVTLSQPFNDSLILDFSSNSRREIFNLQDFKSSDNVVHS